MGLKAADGSRTRVTSLGSSGNAVIRRPRLLLCAPAHRAMVAVLFLATGLCPCSKDDGRDCCVRSRAPGYGRRLVSRCGPLPLLERRRPRLLCALSRTGLWSPSCFSLRASALARKTTAAIIVVRSRAPGYGRRLVSRYGPLPLLERRRPRLLCALSRTGLWSPSCFSLRASALARKTTAEMCSSRIATVANKSSSVNIL